MIPDQSTGYLNESWKSDGRTIRFNPILEDHPPETVAYSDRLKIGWKTLNPTEGSYDWSALDSQLSMAEMRGEQFSFRVMTMAGGIYGEEMVPDWVLQEGAVILPLGGARLCQLCLPKKEWGTFV